VGAGSVHYLQVLNCFCNRAKYWFTTFSLPPYHITDVIKQDVTNVFQTCSYCGRRNPPEAAACSQCGTTFGSHLTSQGDSAASSENQARVRLAEKLMLFRKRRLKRFVLPFVGGVFLPAMFFVNLVLIETTQGIIFWLALGINTGLLWHCSVLQIRWLRGWASLVKYVDWDRVGEAVDRPTAHEMSATISKQRVLRFLPVTCYLSLLVAFALYAGSRTRSEILRNELKVYQQKTGILVLGNLKFQKQVCDALQLLEHKLPKRFAFVKQHVTIVLPGTLDHTEGWIDPPPVHFKEAVRSTLEECAAALVHEAKHIEHLRISQKRHSGGYIFKEVGGPLGETEAGRVTAETFRELGAPEYMAQWAENDRGTGWINVTVAQMGTNSINYWLQSDRVLQLVPLSNARPALWRKLIQVRQGDHSRDAAWGKADGTGSP
jgi:hypothetical protein